MLGSPDVVEETVAVAGREIVIARPVDGDRLLSEEAFEHDEFMPYWVELWPSGVALARALGDRALRGARTLELGCGLGVVSIAAALAGGRVLATDWAPAAVTFTSGNASRNGVQVETAVVDWRRPERLLAGAPWDLVLAADVLYERRNVEPLLDLLPRLAGERGEVLLADPGRPPAAGFWAAADEHWTRRTIGGERPGSVAVHSLRRRAPCGG